MVLFKVYLVCCVLVIFSRTVQFALEYAFEKSKTWCEFYGKVDNSEFLKKIRDEYIGDIKFYGLYLSIVGVIAFIIGLIFGI